MSIHKVLRLTQRRSFVSTLFGFTFVAACLTVSASNILPCHVRPDRTRFSDGDAGSSMDNTEVKVVKRTHRWIAEKAFNER